MPIERTGTAVDRALARGGVHQGIVAEVDDRATTRCARWSTAAAPAAPLLVVLDGIEDPHNVGAILRTVDAAGGARRRATGASCRGA